MGFILALLLGGGGFWLIAQGQSFGFSTVITTVTGLVVVFVIGRRGQEKERQAKWARFKKQVRGDK